MQAGIRTLLIPVTALLDVVVLNVIAPDGTPIVHDPLDEVVQLDVPLEQTPVDVETLGAVGETTNSGLSGARIEIHFSPS